MPITLDVVREARARLGDRIHTTPVQSATTVGRLCGTTLSYKCENLQKTGSFKPRGALNFVSQLSAAQRARGVVTISAGNHAQALAWAAASAGVPATVVMPATASQTKADAARGYGAEVVLHGTVHEAFAKARELEQARGLTFVHPFDDERIVAGAASAGLEILEQVPNVTTIVVPVGGGGLIAGIASAVQLTRPHVKVFGVEPTGAAAMRRSLDQGQPARLETIDTIADGLAPPMAGVLNYDIVSQTVDDVVTVSDDQIIEALRLIFAFGRLVVEPSGAAAVAALVAKQIPVKSPDRVVAVLTGGNVSAADFRRLLEA